MVIGLDCSTTSVKALAVNAHGEVASFARTGLNVLTPQPGYYEQKADSWWQSSVKVLRKLTSDINPDRIKSLAISNQRETFVALDENGKSLRNAITWLDERCKDGVKSYAAKFGERRIHRITGKPVDYAPVVYRLAWMKKYEPEQYKKIARVCDVHSYLAWKFTGSFSTSWASADPTGLFDIKNKKWSLPILHNLNLTTDQLPDVSRPGSVIGKVSPKASPQTGLKTGTLIVAGGGDGQAAGLGSNILSSRKAYLNLGTAVVAGVYSHNYKTSKAFRTMIACGDRGYIYESSLRAGTLAIDWFIKNILKIDPSKETKIYTELQNEAEKVPAGSNGLLFVPYLNGAMNPYWDVDARGVFIGLSSTHNRGHMYRSILEGIAFENHFALLQIEKNTGIRIEEITAIGGGASNTFWCRIFADVTERKIILPKQTEASSLGAAIAASVGTGWYKNIKSAAKEMTGIRKIIKPNLDNLKIYKILFKTYINVYRQTKSINQILSNYN